jgi:hypothetical protein
MEHLDTFLTVLFVMVDDLCKQLPRFESRFSDASRPQPVTRLPGQNLRLLQYPQRMIPYEKGGKSPRSSDYPAPLMVADGSRFLNRALGASRK